VPQCVTVIGVGIAGGNQEGTEADHLGDGVPHRRRITRVLNASGQAFGDAQVAFDLGQQEDAGI
jgi:hypothetical protein